MNIFKHTYQDDTALLEWLKKFQHKDKMGMLVQFFSGDERKVHIQYIVTLLMKQLRDATILEISTDGEIDGSHFEIRCGVES